MDYRHEVKHEISYGDMLALRQRLTAVMYPDPHTVDGRYYIRSLYFDNLDNKALREKIDGINIREKFRIRCYNGDTDFMRLEKKSKINGLCKKQSAPITKEQTELILQGCYDWMRNAEEPLITEFYTKILSEGLRPKTVVDYTREPFVFPAGNVRVTLDYGIKTGLGRTDIFSPDFKTVDTGTQSIILEVKWDEFLPDAVKDAVSLPARMSGTFSKYAVCRIYG